MGALDDARTDGVALRDVGIVVHVVGVVALLGRSRLLPGLDEDGDGLGLVLHLVGLPPAGLGGWRPGPRLRRAGRPPAVVTGLEETLLRKLGALGCTNTSVEDNTIAGTDASNVIWVEDCPDTLLTRNRATNLSAPSAVPVSAGGSNTNLRNDKR